MNVDRRVLNRANSKQDRPGSILNWRAGVLIDSRSVCTRSSCTLNFVDHALNRLRSISYSAGFNIEFSGSWIESIQTQTDSSRSHWFSNRFTTLFIWYKTSTRRDHEGRGKSEIASSRTRHYLHCLCLRLDLHWSHISPDLGFSLLDS